MKPRFLPIFVVIVGILLSILSWALLVREVTHAHFIPSIKIASPWIALVGGVLISLLIAVLLRLTYENRNHEKSLKILGENFKNEITERIQIEESKLELEKALLQGQKLQAIGTLAGGIAHDFNNILYAINGYVEMAREDVLSESIIYQNLGKVLEASHRGQDLVARILTFSRRHHHEFKLIPLKSTIESVLSLLKPTIPSSVVINFTANPNDIMILGNPTQIHQVIVNIINNAVDAMDGEGTINLQISEVNKNDPVFKQFPKIINGSYCKISISDTGHGMDNNTVERIFEPFFTTKEVGKGTGLGLSTVHAIIKEHQGEIMVTSQPGHGATFTMLLPEGSSNETKGV